MQCVYPIDAWRAKKPDPEGKRGLVFNRRNGAQDERFILPCGRCRACRLNYARDWAVRCHHEAQMHERNCFITLTYDADHLPSTHSISIPDLQKFIKRLRRKVATKQTAKIKYFGCAEYGQNHDETIISKLGRPHYHLAIFGYDFADKEFIGKSINGESRYKSEELTKIWKNGNAELGSLTFQSAGYIARYSMKKIGGEMAGDHYQRIDTLTGEVFPLTPEKPLMSKKPPIAYDWVKQFEGDILKGYISIDGKQHPVPSRYYDWIGFKPILDPQDVFDPERSAGRNRTKDDILKIREKRLIRNL